MANWSDLKALVAEVIKTNGNQEITGQVLQNVLKSIISNLGANYQYAGIAKPSTNPGTPDGNIFYLASEKGVYSNFDSYEIKTQELVVFYNTSSAWKHDTLGSLGGGNAVGMNPYFPFAESATFFTIEANKSGLSKEEAQNFIFGIYIDKGKRTDQMYLGRLETHGPSNTLNLRLAINGREVLGTAAVSKTIDALTILELLECNNSGYHGWVALIPANRIYGTFVTGATGGNFERFALSENIFNRCPLFDAYFNELDIEEITESMQDEEEIDENNLLNSIYKRPELYQAIESKLADAAIRKHIYPTDVPKTYPKNLWGKKQFFFDKDLGETVQIMAQREIRMREVSNISFSAWLYFQTSSGFVRRLTMQFGFCKQYPVGISFNETLFQIVIPNTEDYSAASFDSPLEYSISNSVIGEIKYYIDKEIKYGSGEKFVHIRFDKEIPIRYGNLYFNCNCGYITANSKLSVSLAVIDPILTTTDKYEYEKDYSAYNYGYSIAIGDMAVQGKQGRINESALKTPCKVEVYKASISDAELLVNNNGNSVDLELTAESLIEPNYKNTFLINSGYYHVLFDSTEKCYVQFGIKISEVAQILCFRNSSARLFEPLELLSDGLKITASNDYENAKAHVLKVTDDGIAILRFEIYASSLNSTFYWGFNISSNNPISRIKLYNFCISEKPIDPENGIFISRQRLNYPMIAGKSFTIFGDSEFNPGLQYLNVADRLGMPCFVAAYGGHKMGWAGGSTSVDPVTKSWLYTWNIRKLVLNNNTDFYIFCASTNDSDAGISQSEKSNGRYDYQSIENEDVQYVLDNYPSYGDDEEVAQQKIQAFDLLDNQTKYQKFNMTSVYCAYIEQILEANPNAKIILANSPITCTGLLTGTVGSDNKGVWAEGQNPNTARTEKKIIFDRLDELMRKIADKYNLPVIDFYHGVGLTFENYTNYCIDGTHWVDIENTNMMGNTNPITNREGDMLVRFLKEMMH
jgi:hypothetical protein|nr:MAG TPA: hypothetical protein [Caudoviricetes sp.]